MGSNGAPRRQIEAQGVAWKLPIPAVAPDRPFPGAFMNKSLLSSALTAALLSLGAAAPGMAQAQTAAPEASPLTFNAGVVSEYRYRGIS
ncbi:MAG: hypothetical protein EBV28_04060, partial [Betaproteobacteria bacterium]|nr:hypothetical protein [Betaproteobacteria bacterium]